MTLAESQRGEVQGPETRDTLVGPEPNRSVARPGPREKSRVSGIGYLLLESAALVTVSRN